MLAKLNIIKSEGSATVSGFEIFPAYMMAERYGGKINHLVLKHFEKVFAEKGSYTKYIQNDLSSINHLYKDLLFTSKQRGKLVVKPVP